MKSYIFLCAIVFSTQVMAEGMIECVPQNDERFAISNKSQQMNLSEAQSLVQKFNQVAADWVKSKLAKKIEVKIDWDNDRVNASATRDDDDNVVINVLGGMIRHPEMNPDAFLLLLCHELGHHLGGAPRQFRGQTTQRSWSSAEGQADYFATSKCLPRLFRESEAVFVNFDDAMSVCSNSTTCAKSVNAALSLTRLFASLKRGLAIPQVMKKDSFETVATIYGHSSPQCRLDTFISGSLCDLKDEDFDPFDPTIGACVRSENGFDDDVGARPRCWYFPQPIFK